MGLKDLLFDGFPTIDGGRAEIGGTLKVLFSRVLLSFLLVFGFVGQSLAKNLTASDLNDFKSDGCSGVPDGHWGFCCYEHDFAYWTGGQFEERLQADLMFKECIDSVGGPGQAYYEFVRVAGAQFFGKAWPNQNVRTDISDEETEIMEGEKRLWASLNFPPQFNFVLTENILFKPIRTQDRELLKEKIFKHLGSAEYKEFYQEFTSNIGREPVFENYRK